MRSARNVALLLRTRAAHVDSLSAKEPTINRRMAFRRIELSRRLVEALLPVLVGCAEVAAWRRATLPVVLGALRLVIETESVGLVQATAHDQCPI
jgi:hypothetical protein